MSDALDVEQISRIGGRPALSYRDRWHGVRWHVGACQAALRATVLHVLLLFILVQGAFTHKDL
jgi:hypothetical protein